MFRDTVMRYYDPELNYGCSEALLYAANEYFDLNLSKEAFLASSAFGGGMYHNEVCGAVSSSLAVIGILYSTGKCHNSDEMKTIEKEMFRRFIEKLGIQYCDALKEKHKTEEKRCEKMLVSAADILEELIREHPINKNKTVNCQNL